MTWIIFAVFTKNPLDRKSFIGQTANRKFQIERFPFGKTGVNLHSKAFTWKQLLYWEPQIVLGLAITHVNVWWLAFKRLSVKQELSLKGKPAIYSSFCMLGRFPMVLISGVVTKNGKLWIQVAEISFSCRELGLLGTRSGAFGPYKYLINSSRGSLDWYRSSKTWWPLDLWRCS